MRKSFTKFICLASAITVAISSAAISACSKKYKVTPLKDGNLENAEITSNGGFAVKKGGYIYFVNGRENYTADNSFGTPVKGSLMRISESDFTAHNYSSVDTVVPSVIYSGNTNAGIYVYGDSVYYTTPSTEKNSNGEVQNSYLQFKSTKLDGTGTGEDYYVQLASNSAQYRYVEVNGTVYLLYVAEKENLYGTEYKNLHSYNTATGKDTLLAYNVSDVIFDKNDLTNPTVYYTMTVTDYVTGTSYAEYYNQIYTVKADAVTPNEYNLKDIVPDYDESKDPLYINCGKLAFDGIGKIQGMTESVTPFNGKDADKVERQAYTYSVSSYENGYLYYTRTTAQNSTGMLFAVKESEISADGWNPVTGNPAESACLLRDGSSASGYIYIYDGGNLSGALILSADGIVKANVKDGKLTNIIDNVNRFFVTDDGQATLLFTANHDGKNYIYYSLSGGNGYSVNRICYDGAYADYNGLPVNSDIVNEYDSVKVLDLDVSSTWYKPEIIANQLLFATQTDDMVNYEYVMACDLSKDGKIMTNAQLDEYNEKFESIEKAISDVDATVYENLQNALRYGYFTGDKDKINDVIQAFVDKENRDKEYIWSEQSVNKFNEFVLASAEGEWKEFSDTKKVNGKDVASNKRDFYYALLGKMTKEDEEAYLQSLSDKYLHAYPEEVEKEGWYDGLSKGAKAGFIIGVCAGGILVLGGAFVLVRVILKKRKEKLPSYTKRRIKVDTTDDKNIDVYGGGENTDGVDGE